jgi:hypothetical protein
MTSTIRRFALLGALLGATSLAACESDYEKLTNDLLKPGSDAGPDASMPGTMDASTGTPDTGTAPDAAGSDAGSTDSGSGDAGDAGVAGDAGDAGANGDAGNANANRDAAADFG